MPAPYHDPTNTRDDLLWSGWFTLPYRASLERKAVMPEFGLGACAADGDCVITGCGNHCEAWPEAPHGAGCPAYRDLDDAHCGCVASTCGWFVQAEQYQVKAELHVEGWVVPTKPDPRELTSGEEVFHRLLEREWFPRQLARVARLTKSPVPPKVEFEVILDARFGVIKASVTPTWLHDVFLHLPVPVPTFEDKRTAPRRIVARGTLRVTET